jgi:hypothetical protein
VELRIPFNKDKNPTRFRLGSATTAPKPAEPDLLALGSGEAASKVAPFTPGEKHPTGQSRILQVQSLGGARTVTKLAPMPFRHIFVSGHRFHNGNIVLNLAIIKGFTKAAHQLQSFQP